jgi:hypothetical protein
MINSTSSNRAKRNSARVSGLLSWNAKFSAEATAGGCIVFVKIITKTMAIIDRAADRYPGPASK